jgi:hypothetical protein
MASMVSEKLSVNRENPRNLTTATTRAMPAELAAQKPPLTILERFNALLKQRGKIRVSAGDDAVSPPGAEEIVQIYELLLSELTFNSKPIITDLTIIAGEQREHGKGIADAICSRIIEVGFGACGILGRMGKGFDELYGCGIYGFCISLVLELFLCNSRVLGCVEIKILLLLWFPLFFSFALFGFRERLGKEVMEKF